MMNGEYDIFVKKKFVLNTNTILSKDEIMNSIPKEATENENIDQQNNATEYRWRIIKLPNKKNDIIEMSYKKPNEERFFMSRVGNWVKYDGIDFSSYVVKTYYFYQKE